MTNKWGEHFKINPIVIGIIMIGSCLCSQLLGATEIKTHWKKKESPWSVQYYLENYNSAENDLDGFVSSHKLAINYKISDREKIQGRYVFQTRYQGEGFTQSDAELRHYLTLGKKWGWNWNQQLRSYLPLKEYSREVGQWQLRGYWSAQKTLNRTWDVSLIFNPRVYFYSEDELGQMSSHIFYVSRWGQKINGHWSLAYWAGYAHGYRHEGTTFSREISEENWKNPDNNVDHFYDAISTEVKFNKRYSLYFMYEQMYNIRGSRSFSPLNPKESGYYIDLLVKL